MVVDRSKYYTVGIEDKNELANKKIKISQEEKNKGGFLGGLEYLGKSAVAGVNGVFEGIGDLIAGTAAMISGDKEYAKYIYSKSDIQDWQRRFTEDYNPNGTMSVLGEISSSLGQSLTYAGLTAVTGGAAGISYALIGTSAAGNGISEAYAKTGELGAREYVRGLFAGATEAATEALLGNTVRKGAELVGKVGKQSLYSTVNKAINNKVASNMLANIALRVVSDAAEEGAEEGASYFLNWVWDRALKTDPDAEFVWGDFFKDIALGAASGFLMGAPTTAISTSIATRKGSNIMKSENGVTRTINNAEAILSEMETNHEKNQEPIINNMRENLQNYKTAKAAGSEAMQKYYLGNIAYSQTQLEFSRAIVQSGAEMVSVITQEDVDGLNALNRTNYTLEQAKTPGTDAYRDARFMYFSNKFQKANESASSAIEAFERSETEKMASRKVNADDAASVKTAERNIGDLKPGQGRDFSVDTKNRKDLHFDVARNEDGTYIVRYYSNDSERAAYAEAKTAQEAAEIMAGKADVEWKDYNPAEYSNRGQTAENAAETPAEAQTENTESDASAEAETGAETAEQAENAEKPAETEAKTEKAPEKKKYLGKYSIEEMDDARRLIKGKIAPNGFDLLTRNEKIRILEMIRSAEGQNVSDRDIKTAAALMLSTSDLQIAFDSRIAGDGVYISDLGDLVKFNPNAGNSNFVNYVNSLAENKQIGKTSAEAVASRAIIVKGFGDRSVRFSLWHEISHSIENSKNYAKIAETARKVYETSDERRAKIAERKEQYQKYYDTLYREQVQSDNADALKEGTITQEQIDEKAEKYIESKAAETADIIEKEINADALAFLMERRYGRRAFALDHPGKFSRMVDAARSLWLKLRKKDNSMLTKEARKVMDAFEETILSFDKERAEKFVTDMKLAAEAEKAKAEEDAIVKMDLAYYGNGMVTVIASRNVITGTDVPSMRKQITQFFNDLLEKNKKIEINALDGSVLTITKDETANKARDNYRYENGKRVKLTDDEYRIKARVETHIDEVVEASTSAESKSDNKGHAFAKDGFTYREAYFQDFDGTYYKIKLSIGNADGVATVYNVGRIQKDTIPSANLIAVRGSKARGIASSDNSISQTAEKSTLSAKKDSENVKRSLSEDGVRYNLPETDSDGNALTENQRKYFSETKVKGADGRLLAVYHGSKAKFNEFSYDFMSQNGSSEGQGFYFTDKKEMAEGYQKDGGQLLHGYLNITNPLSDSEKTLKRKEVERLLRAVDPTGDDVIINYDNSGIGYPSRSWYSRALSDAVSAIYEYADTDSEILGEIANSGASSKTVLTKAKQVLGYDGYIVTDKYDGAGIYVAFTSEQFKNADNENPTSNPDIRYNLPRDTDISPYPENRPAVKGVKDGATLKAIANIIHPKVYGKQAAMRIIGANATYPGMTKKMLSSLADMIWQGLNTYTSRDAQNKFAHDMAEYIYSQIAATVEVQNEDTDGYADELAKIHTGIGRLEIREEYDSEFIAALGKDEYKRFKARWGYKGRAKKDTNGNITRPGAYNMTNFIADYAAEGTGTENLADMNVVEAMIEIDRKYDEMREYLYGTKSVVDDWTDAEYQASVKQLEEAILKEFREGGEKSKSWLEEDARNQSVKDYKARLAERQREFFRETIQKETQKYRDRIDALRTKYYEERAKTEGKKTIQALITTGQELRALIDPKYASMHDMPTAPYDIRTDNQFKSLVKAATSIFQRGELSHKKVRAAMVSLRQFFNSDNAVFIEYAKSMNEKIFGIGENTGMEQVQEELDNLFSVFEASINDDGEFKSSALSLKEIESALNLLRFIKRIYTSYDTIYKDGKAVNLTRAAEDYQKIAETSATVRKEMAKKRSGSFAGKTFGALGKVSWNYAAFVSSPYVVAEHMDGYDPNGFFTEYFGRFTRDQWAQQAASIEMLEPIEKFFKEHKGYDQRLMKERITVNGRSMIVGEVINIYLQSTQENGAMTLYGENAGGFTYTAEDGKRTTFAVTLSGKAEAENFYRALNAEDRKFIDLMMPIYEECGRLKAETDMRLYGFTNVVEFGKYYTLFRDMRFGRADVSDTRDAMKDVQVVVNKSFNKKRMKNAKRIPLKAVNAYTALLDHVRGITQYAYMGEDINSFTRLYNKNIGDSLGHTLRMQAQEVWGDDGKGGFEQYVQNYLADIQGVRKDSVKWFAEIRSKYAVAALAANVKVILSQTASYPTALAYLDLDSVVYGINHLAKKADRAEMDKYSQTAFIRSKDKTVVKAEGLIDWVSEVGSALMKPIGWSDRFTIGQLWMACQKQAEKNNKGAIGTESNKIAAGELLNEINTKTQPTYQASDRSAFQRSSNEVLRTFSMFTSVAMKQSSMLINAADRVAYLSEKSKVYPNTVSAKEISNAKKKLARTTAAVAVANLMYIFLCQGVKWLLDKDDPDENDEKNVLQQMVESFADTNVSMFPLFKEIYGLLRHGYDLDVTPVSLTQDLIENVVSIFNTDWKDKQESRRNTRNMIYTLSNMVGIPAKNMMNLITGLVSNASDVAEYRIEYSYYDKTFAKDLADAAEDKDENLAEEIIRDATDNNVGSVPSDKAIAEMVRLAFAGENILPANGRSRTLTVGSESKKLTNKQMSTVKKVYSGATEAVEKMIGQSYYDALDDKAKAKAIRAIYAAYLSRAKAEIFPDEAEETTTSLYGQLMDISAFAAHVAYISGLDGDRKKSDASKYLSKQKNLTDAEKQLIFYACGYRSKDRIAYLKKAYAKQSSVLKLLKIE